jgi:polysaccharide export outer membrane protein
MQIKLILLLALVVTLPSTAQQNLDALDASQAKSTYLLGTGDQISVRVIDVEEFGTAPYRIDSRGMLMLPLVGRQQAAGLTIEQFEKQIAEKLKKYVREPEVVINILETRSQPVSILGAVRSPGVHQLQGSKTLFEVISMAGGLAPDAGYSIKITRRKEWGKLPLPNAKDDVTGQFSVGEINVKDVMNAEKPDENVAIKPNDVISVPKGEIVYVVGGVKKSGGFVLGEREKVTALQALSMAEGLDQFSAPNRAKIIRPIKGSDQKQEIALDLKKVLDGKATDVPLLADDVLFVPSSSRKRATARAVDALIGVGSGLAIYRGGVSR